MALPAAAGALIVLLAWLAGPGLLGIGHDVLGAPVQAEVTKPAPCGQADAKETVRFTTAGKVHEGTLDGCGHGKGERVEVAVPEALPDQGAVAVTVADTSMGAADARRPLGLALLVFACFSGGMFAYLWLSIPLRPKAAKVS
ncbi:hypothetical protein AB0F15_17560 [Amycolatopsis sp. NPDC026612]|uniref:hypothetical protein n=1 Tax=Amycolatopsis sp. NPDC026612 TaxID=3155466 RepID=UPI0033FB1893